MDTLRKFRLEKFSKKSLAMMEIKLQREHEKALKANKKRLEYQRKLNRLMKSQTSSEFYKKSNTENLYDTNG